MCPRTEGFLSNALVSDPKNAPFAVSIRYLPHSPQKKFFTALPLSAVLATSFGVPVTLKSSSRTIKLYVNGAPESLRQPSQWQRPWHSRF